MEQRGSAGDVLVRDAADGGIDDRGINDRGIDLAMMQLLREHVPLSLLVDLAYPDGPDSRAILAAEAN